MVFVLIRKLSNENSEDTHATNRERHAHDYITGRKFILAILWPGPSPLPCACANNAIDMASVMDGKWHYCFSLICFIF